MSSAWVGQADRCSSGCPGFGIPTRTPVGRVAQLPAASGDVQNGCVRPSPRFGADFRETTGNVEVPASKHTYFEDAPPPCSGRHGVNGQKGDGAASPTFSAVTADELVVGSTLQLFMLEKRFTGPDRQLHLPPREQRGGGQHVDQRAARSESPGQHRVPGGTLDLVETAIAGATYADPGTKPTFTSPDVSEITIAGITGALCFNNLIWSSTATSAVSSASECSGSKEQVLGRFPKPRSPVPRTSRPTICWIIWSRRRVRVHGQSPRCTG